jgi:hypothetical protein
LLQKEIWKNKADTCYKKRYGKIKQIFAAKRDIEK